MRYVATQISGPGLVTGARASRTTVALKLLVALSGLIFIGYVLLHMYGNLKAFAGHDSFNEYAEHLRTFGEPILPRGGLLWMVRVVLIMAVLTHVYASMTLWRRAQNARPVKYARKKRTGAIWASGFMRWGGLALLLFIVWHLLHFTIAKINPAGGATNDPFNLMVDSFDVWWMTAIYLAAMLALGAHIHHGFWSACQTLGLTNTARSRGRAKRVSLTLAVVVAVGFSLVPLAVVAGVIEK